MNHLRMLVNLWLLAVLGDGVIRLLGGLLQLVVDTRIASYLVLPFEGFALLAGFAVWVGAAVSTRIPARVVLPPMLALCWMMLGALPFSVLYYNHPGLQICVGLVLIASVGLSELLARTVGHGRWLLGAETFGEDLAFSWKRLLGWLAGWWIGGPTASAAWLIAGVAWTIWYGTAGYVIATPAGLSVAHRAYVKGEDTVDLVAMIHLGEADAYDRLFDHIPTDGTLVLAEGVRDPQGLLKAPRDAYGRAAAAVGLSVQAPAEEMFHDMEVRNADVDVADFDPLTLELLSAALGLYAAADDPTPAVMNYLMFWNKHRDDANKVTDQLFEDILFARNRHLLGELDEALEERDRVVLPWGALHLWGISEALEEQGWTLTETHRVVLIRWSTLLS